MRHHFATVLAACLLTVFSTISIHADQAAPAAASSASIDEILKSLRGDLQNSRSDIVAKNVTLTSAQARDFWPLFDEYQKAQNVVMDDQLKQVQWYIENFEGADDAAALKLISAHLERDTKMTALRQAWLGRFQKVLGAKLAVRVMQIDRRVSLMQQAYVARKFRSPTDAFFEVRSARF